MNSFLDQLHLCHFGIYLNGIMLEIELDTPFLHCSGTDNGFLTQAGHHQKFVGKEDVFNVKIDSNGLVNFDIMPFRSRSYAPHPAQTHGLFNVPNIIGANAR